MNPLTAGLRPVHPGEILLCEFIRSSDDFASIAQTVKLDGIIPILAETAPVTEEVAYGLARIWGTQPKFWLNLQAAYDEKTK